MRPELVVVQPPLLDLLLGVFHRQEPVDVQAFVPERAVERLDRCVIHRFTGSREVQRDPVFIGPLSQSSGDKFGAVVALDAVRGTPVLDQPLNNPGDIRASQALARLDRQTLPAIIIDYR